MEGQIRKRDRAIVENCRTVYQWWYTPTRDHSHSVPLETEHTAWEPLSALLVGSSQQDTLLRLSILLFDQPLR